jgi:hypothetical protein
MAPRCAKDARRRRRCGGFSAGQQRARRTPAPMSNDITAKRPGGEPVTKAKFQMMANARIFLLQSQEKKRRSVR